MSYNFKNIEKKWQKNLKFQTWIYIMVIFMH